MTQEQQPKPRRLRELEAEAGVSFNSMADETTVNYKYGKSAGFQECWDWVAPVLAAAKGAFTIIDSALTIPTAYQKTDEMIKDRKEARQALRDALAGLEMEG